MHSAWMTIAQTYGFRVLICHKPRTAPSVSYRVNVSPGGLSERFSFVLPPGGAKAKSSGVTAGTFFGFVKQVYSYKV